MHELVAAHTRMLHVLCAAFLLSTVLYGLVVWMVSPPETPVIAQTQPLLWVFSGVTVLNLLTIMPVYRAMLARPRQVYAVSHDPLPLLAAHRAAHLVAFARLEAVAVLGLVLFFVTGRRDWFWYFNGAALVGMLVLWPLKDKVDSLLQRPRFPGELERLRQFLLDAMKAQRDGEDGEILIVLSPRSPSVSDANESNQNQKKPTIG